MTTKPADTAIEAAARAMAPDAWHENGRGGYTLVMAEEEQARARKKARAAVIAYLTATMHADAETVEQAARAIYGLHPGWPVFRGPSRAQAWDELGEKTKEFYHDQARAIDRAMRSAEISSLKGKVGS